MVPISTGAEVCPATVRLFLELNKYINSCFDCIFLIHKQWTKICNRVAHQELPKGKLTGPKLCSSSKYQRISNSHIEEQIIPA